MSDQIHRKVVCFEADEAYKEARDLMKAGDFDRALARLRRANQLLRPFANIGRQMNLLALDVLTAKAECLCFKLKPTLDEAFACYDQAAEMIVSAGWPGKMPGMLLKQLHVLIWLSPHTNPQVMKRVMVVLRELDKHVTQQCFEWGWGMSLSAYVSFLVNQGRKSSIKERLTRSGELMEQYANSRADRAELRKHYLREAAIRSAYGQTIRARRAKNKAANVEP